MLIASRSISDPPKERNPLKPGVASGPKTPRRLAATTITSASWPSKSPTATETIVRPNRNAGLPSASFTDILTGAGARSGYRRPAVFASL